MLCHDCRRQLSRNASVCGACGAPVRGAGNTLELVLADRTRVLVTGTLTIGRARENTIQLGDATVSRSHARVAVGDDGEATVEDVGSSSGTFIDGRRVTTATPLRDGVTLRLGDATLRVEARRAESEAGRTVVVPAGASLVVPAVGVSKLAGASAATGLHPRVRSGWALKRLDDSEGARRFVLRDLRGGGFVRMTAEDAALFELLDGTRSLPDLIAEVEQRGGAAARARLARLLADLGERGLLDGVGGAAGGMPGHDRRLARLFQPRERVVTWLGPLCERAYRNGAFLLFTRPARVLLAALGIGGAATFVYLVVARYGTPFVVAKRVGLGGLVFLGGRFVVVAAHELAHALTVVSFGRRVARVGLKLLFIFPYAFVDTSEAWFEPRRRRLAISAAGPASDLTVGALFAIGALTVGSGTDRDILFNLALAAYVGAFFNLNPALERDGYHMLVDVLGEPGLRRRARAWLVRRLSGQEMPGGEPRALRIYAFATAAWSFSGVFFSLVLTKRYYDRLVVLAPKPVVLAAFSVIYLFALLPAVVLLGRPLLERRRRPHGIPSVAG